MTQDEFRVGFKNSPMKHAKLRGLKRNATVVLGNFGTEDDVELLEIGSTMISASTNQ